MSAHPARTNVLIAGGGVAALETALALQALTDEGVDVELLAPEPAFWHRPPAVAEPFGLAEVRHFPLPELAAGAGATFTLGTLASVDVERRLACTSAGMVIPFDVLVIATGALPEPAVPGAVTFRGPADCEKIDALLAEVASKGARRVAFVIPAGASWSLLAYELALLTAAWASARAISGLEVVIVTPEDRPLAIMGRKASGAVEALLARHAVRLLANTHAVAVRDGQLVLLQNEPLHADWVIATPRLRGQDIGGLPQNANGFVRVDEHGRIGGLDGVYAAGDVTTSRSSTQASRRSRPTLSRRRSPRQPAETSSRDRSGRTPIAPVGRSSSRRGHRLGRSPANISGRSSSGPSPGRSPADPRALRLGLCGVRDLFGGPGDAGADADDAGHALDEPSNQPQPTRRRPPRPRSSPRPPRRRPEADRACSRACAGSRPHGSHVRSPRRRARKLERGRRE